jgi:2-polyprenyl-6-hydroxyphenyl methylase/3-demethylubiquinone-9 3-methyltransferase
VEQGTNAEAEAFNRRIEERVKAGFVPDLRRAAKCTYFYKSFWRDPHFVKLYLLQIVNELIEMLGRHAGGSLRILDVGCGAGYISLEFARAGHHVFGIDISDKCIEVAKRYRDSNPLTDGFGSLDYGVMTLEQVTGPFDCLLFSGMLHHLKDPEQAIWKGLELLPPRGLVLCYEPCHEEWRIQDAAQVALIRGIIALTGFWYEGPSEQNDREWDIEAQVQDVYVEYVTERDKHEIGGQSPGDNSSSGRQILDALRRHLDELEYKPGSSFIHRVLGGLRGAEGVIYRLADFLAAYETYADGKGFLNPNAFFLIGRKAPRQD